MENQGVFLYFPGEKSEKILRWLQKLLLQFSSCGKLTADSAAHVTLCLFFFGQVIKMFRFHIFLVHSLSQLTGEKASQHSKVSLTTNIRITNNNTVQSTSIWFYMQTNKKKKRTSFFTWITYSRLFKRIDFICKRRYSESLSYMQHLSRNKEQQPLFRCVQ